MEWKRRRRATQPKERRAAEIGAPLARAAIFSSGARKILSARARCGVALMLVPILKNTAPLPPARRSFLSLSSAHRLPPLRSCRPSQPRRVILSLPHHFIRSIVSSPIYPLSFLSPPHPPPALHDSPARPRPRPRQLHLRRRRKNDDRAFR
jgi:hypothetical protein